MKNWLSKEQDKTQTKKDDGLFLDSSTPRTTSPSVHMQSFISGTETEPLRALPIALISQHHWNLNLNDFVLIPIQQTGL